MLALVAFMPSLAIAQDLTAPRITSIERQTPATSPTNADSVTWRVTFDEAVVPPTVFGLTNVANVLDDATLQLDGASSVTTAVVNGTTYLFAAGFYDFGVSVFSVADNGALTNVANVSDDATLELDDASSVTTAVVDGTTYLFVAAPTGSVSVFSVADNGALTNVFNVSDDATLELAGAFSLTTAVVNGTTYLFAAGNADNGVSVFSVADNGALTNVANVSDDATLELDGVWSVTTAVVDGTTYLFAAGFFDDGVSVFSVADNGALTNVFNVSDDATLELDNASSVTTAVVNGTTYLFAAGYRDHGVSVFSVADNGALTNVANVTDDATTLELNGAYSVTTAVVNGTTYLFTAGYLDDGVSVFSVADNGALTNVANVTDDATLELKVPISVTTAVVDGTTYLFAAGFEDNGVSVFSITPPAAAVANFTLAGSTATLAEATVSGTQVDATASGGDLANLNATVTLGFAAGQTFTDLAGNTLVNTTPTGTNDNTYVIDNTAPRLDTIAGGSTYTNLDSLSFRATFDGPVVNVSAADFSIGGTTATVTNVVANSSSDYSLTVSGGDLADIADTTVTIALSGSQDIADVSGNALTDTSPTGYIDSIFVNNTLPVGTFTSAAVAPVSQPFTVNLAFTPQAGFADNILALTQSDIVVGNGTIESFTLTTGGGVTTGADIVVRPTADGAVTLDLPENSVFDEAENQNPAATQFSINADVTVPTINIFKPGAPCPCNGPITVTMSFSEGGITGFDINDLVVTGGTLSNFSFVNSGSVTLTPTADGTMTLQIPAGSMTDPDGFGNLESNLFSADFDTTRPTVTLTTAAVAPVTGEFDIDITFSEPMTNIGNTSAWTLTNGSRLSVTGSGANYVMRARPLASQGTLTLDLAENGFSDAAGNGVVAPTQFSIAYDAANPRIASIERFSPAAATTNADSLTFTVTFSEDVTNVDAGDFDIYTLDVAPANTTATITDVTPVSASVYRVTVSGGNLASLSFTSITLHGRTDGNIRDAANNVMTAGSPQTPAEGYTMDNTAPVLNSFARQTPADEQTNADSLVWLATFNDTAYNVDSSDFEVSGSTASVTDISPVISGDAPPGVDAPLSNPVSAQYLVTVSGGDLAGLDAAVGLNLAAGQDITDFAGNTVANSEPATDETYDVRNTPSAIASVARLTPSASLTNADSLTWRLTFAQIDPYLDLPTSAFTALGTTGTVTNVSRFSIGFDVTVSGGDLAGLNGDVTLGLADSDFADDYGNIMDRTIPAGAELTYTLDNVVPTVEITSASGTLVNGDFEVTVTFSEPVTGFDGNDIVRSNSGYYGFSGSGTTYTFTAAPSSNPFTFDIPAGVAQDAAGNGNTAAAQFVGTVDSTRPSVTLSTTAGIVTFGRRTVSGPFTLDIEFSETVEDFVIGDLSLTNATASNFSGSGTTYSVLITPTPNAQMEILLEGNAFSDPAGNLGIGAQLEVDDDQTPPRVFNFQRLTPADARTSADVLVWLFQTNENTIGVDAADFTVTGTSATITDVTSDAGGTRYEITVSGGDLAGLNGDVTLSLAPGQNITDFGGNTFADTTPLSTHAPTYTVDNTGPTATSVDNVQPGTSPTNADTLIWAIFMSEGLSNLDLADIQLTGTTATITQITNPQPTLYAFTASGGDLADLNGTVTIGLARGHDVTDEAGNALASLAPTSSEDDRSVVIDNRAPTLAISGPTGPVSGAFTATFTFSDAVTGFALGDIDLNNAVASNFAAVVPAGDGLTSIASARSEYTYTATITPTADGAVTVDVAGSVATDAAGNNNTAATQFSVNNDQTAPTVAITSPTGPVSGAFTATFTFSEDVSDFVVGDIVVGNGAASAFDDSAAPVFTATITPAADGPVTVDVAGAVATDAAGNDNTAATQFSVTNDETAPTVAITGPTGPVSGAFTATFTFDEDVTDFVAGDISVGNGAASAFDDAAAPIYTATITPAADGAVTIDVAGSVATDAAGNDNTAATQFSITNDETAPTVASIVRQTPTVSPTDADSLVWRVTFSETVVNAGVADFSVSGTTGTVSDVTAIDGATYDVTASGGDLANLNGTVTLGFAAGQDIADEAGNTLSDTTPTGTDERAWSVINDADAPTVASITRDTPSTELTNADSLTWVVRFSENVTDIDMGDFVVSGTTGTVTSVSPQAVNLPPSVTGNGYSAPMVVSSSAFTVTASGGDLASYNGVVTLSFAQGQDITDEAGNALTNTTPTGANENSYTLDNTAPTVSLSTTATAPVSGPFTLTATFSEDVTGFDVSDLSVGNGTASNFAATSATIYTATITPGAGSSTTVDVASAAATDPAGNDNTAATQFSITHDPDRTLTVSLPGVGSGTVSSAPAGIDCGTECSQDYTLGTSVTLTAAADTGSTFAGWTAGPCIGTTTATCAVTMNADTSVSARFTLDNPPAGRIVAATLPAARSGYVGGPVISAFLSVVSRTSSPAQSCQVTAPAGAPVTLGYNQLDTNGDPTGPDSPLFDIVPGGALNFVIGMTPTAQTAAGGYNFLPVITCENASLDPIVGVNSVFLTIGAAPAPDILSIAATPSGDGVIRIPAPGRVQFMTAAAVNVGIGDGSGAAGEVTLTTTVDTGAASLPLNLEICQINAASVCITPRSSSITSTMTGSDPLFFAVFVRDTSTGGIPFDPANSRVFLRFADATGTIRSATSAAVTAPAPEAAPEIVSSLPQGRWSVLMRQPEGVWPGLARTSLYVTETGQVLVDDGITPRLTTIEAMAADNDADATQARFMALGHDGLWTNAGAIRLGAPWADTTGEFWGVRDTRSDAATNWTDLAGPFGNSLILSETGEFRGTIDGCAVYGQASGLATQGVTLSLSGCAQSGPYLALIDLPANENDAPVLLIASGTRGWRVER
ncbi:hypothetical protein HXX25_05595 [Hyphobacterium sp. CCMP332]|uniref:Ig-like domain-containing protein n=1 Tax=Hyphobacterium sp. CCMP332 TaxID=2749086 RepID=UPI0016503697|nr:Ig-like domain-containing protein [Hyphobacterium sp. CCMP332]QNL18864.1 hypothetical protein HXX25_05595 [Hyphobacterium sp. CCMP332]